MDETVWTGRIGVKENKQELMRTPPFTFLLPALIPVFAFAFPLFLLHLLFFFALTHTHATSQHFFKTFTLENATNRLSGKSELDRNKSKTFS
jgi:hypothetical protein